MSRETPLGGCTFRLGFIGFGEAAFHIAKGLAGAGLSPILAYDVAATSPAVAATIAGRAAMAGVELVSSPAELALLCDTLLCATSAKYALSIAEQFAPLLVPGTVYADLNSASPGTKRAAAAAIANAGGLFADVAVMELVPPHGHRVPMTLSGPGATALHDRLSLYGARTSVLGPEPGAASALKMLRSIFMKGLTALLLETLTAGRKAGVDRQIMDSISGTIESRPLRESATLLITRTAIAAERRAAEMDEVVGTLEELGLDSTLAAATGKKLKDLAALDLRSVFGNTPPEQYETVLDAILDGTANRK